MEPTLRFESGVGAWLSIKHPGSKRRHIEIPEADVAATVEQFLAIGDSVERFQEFVNARV